ncbi:MAG: hypothetical protein WCO56_18495 [Verrucomicrobiota bacterium]
MNKFELKTKLEQAGICSAAFTLDGGLPNEQYVLNQEAKGKWEVYYSERGQKTGLRYFDSESDACQFFLEHVLHDPTTKRRERS